MSDFARPIGAAERHVLTTSFAAETLDFPGELVDGGALEVVGIDALPASAVTGTSTTMSSSCPLPSNSRL